MKGGVGKTTTSINIATGIANKGYKTLLIDLDPQSNATSIFLDEDTENTTSTLIKGESTIHNSIVKVKENLWLMPSELNLAITETEIRMQTTAPQHNRLQKALVQVADKFDYCIIDCPPSLGLLTVNAVIASSLIMIPIKPDRFAVQAFQETITHMTNLRENFELSVDFKIVFTIVNRNNSEKNYIEQFKSTVEGKIFNTQIRSQPRPIVDASSERRAVIEETDPRVGVAEDMRQLVNEILGVS